MISSAVIRVGDYDVNIAGGTPKEVLPLLKPFLDEPVDLSASGGYAVGQIIRTIGILELGLAKSFRRPIIISGKHRDGHWSDCDFRYEIHAKSFNYRVSMIRLFSGQGRFTTDKAPPVFDGSLKDFEAWVASYTGLEHFRHRLVEFKYLGGENPGTKRRVRVEEIDTDAGNPKDTILRGYDLDKPGRLNESWRNYFVSRIEGDIKVL